MVVPVSRPTQRIAGIEQNDPYSELFLSQKRKRFLTGFGVVVVSLVTSLFLYACESWTLTAELQRRIQAMEMRCYSIILRISYKNYVTNEEVRAKIPQAIGPHEDLLTIVKRRKPQWYCHFFPFIRSGQNHLARHSERGKKTRQTEEEVERQHHGMDRPGVR